MQKCSADNLNDCLSCRTWNVCLCHLLKTTFLLRMVVVKSSQSPTIAQHFRAEYVCVYTLGMKSEVLSMLGKDQPLTPALGQVPLEMDSEKGRSKCWGLIGANLRDAFRRERGIVWAGEMLGCHTAALVAKGDWSRDGPSELSHIGMRAWASVTLYGPYHRMLASPSGETCSGGPDISWQPRAFQRKNVK